MTAVALGTSAIVERSVRVFTALKLLGACYVVYLGVRAIRERRALARALDAAIVPAGPTGSSTDTGPHRRVRRAAR